MDDFTIDEQAMTVTIAHNMNRVITDNARSTYVVPFE